MSFILQRCKWSGHSWPTLNWHNRWLHYNTMPVAPHLRSPGTYAKWWVANKCLLLTFPTSSLRVYIIQGLPGKHRQHSCSNTCIFTGLQTMCGQISLQRCDLKHPAHCWRTLACLGIIIMTKEQGKQWPRCQALGQQKECSFTKRMMSWSRGWPGDQIT